MRNSPCLFVQLCVPVSLALAPFTINAQRLDDFVLAGVRQHQASSAETSFSVTQNEPASILQRVAEDSIRARTRPRRLVGWFVLGGAAAGVGTLAVLVARGCGKGCYDDGGYQIAASIAPYFVVAGAVAGGIVGTMVDHARHVPINEPFPNDRPPLR